MAENNNFMSYREFLETASDEEIMDFLEKRSKRIRELKEQQAEQFKRRLKEMKQLNIEKRKEEFDKAIKQILETRNKLIQQFKEFFEEYKDVIDKLDQWEEITGLSAEELDRMELFEALDLIREKLNNLPKIETLDAIFPQKYIMPNNKLANEMPNISKDYNAIYDLEVNKRKKAYTTVSLNYNDENIKIHEKDKRFTAYDRSVHNAVCSIYEAGNTTFTADQVYRAMNGYDDSQYVSPQAIGAVTKSLDKSRSILVKIDYTNEAKAYKKDVEQFVMEDYILSAKKITLKAGGKEVIGYKLNSKPILYQYAQLTNQVITVPSKLLNTKDVIKSTPEVIVIREYLIKRIEEMKNPSNKMGNKILFESIYNIIDQPDPDKKKAKKVRDIVKTLLTKFKTEKYIKDFEFYKEGRSFKGVEIIY